MVVRAISPSLTAAHVQLKKTILMIHATNNDIFLDVEVGKNDEVDNKGRIEKNWSICFVKESISEMYFVKQYKPIHVGRL
jgi:hypothetical protein